MDVDMICYCGHDCGRCVIYTASRNDDDCLKNSARGLYKDEFGIDLPADAFICAGGRSDEVFSLCADCPFRKCCRAKGIDSCAECEEYPCGMLSEYQKKYVNKFGRI